MHPLRSLLEAEEASWDCTLVWTGFERLLEDWQTTVQSIADRLEIDWPNNPARRRKLSGPAVGYALVAVQSRSERRQDADHQGRTFDLPRGLGFPRFNSG
jgi:hypothetical protein